MIVSRKKLFAKYNGRCAYCGKPLGRSWERDHVQPIVRFRNVRWTFSGRHGCKYPERHVLENIVPACKPCNTDKGPLDVETWRASLRWPGSSPTKPVVFWMERRDDEKDS